MLAVLSARDLDCPTFSTRRCRPFARVQAGVGRFEGADGQMRVGGVLLVGYIHTAMTRRGRPGRNAILRGDFLQFFCIHLQRFCNAATIRPGNYFAARLWFLTTCNAKSTSHQCHNLADALASGASPRKGVQVQVLSSASLEGARIYGDSRDSCPFSVFPLRYRFGRMGRHGLASDSGRPNDLNLCGGSVAAAWWQSPWTCIKLPVYTYTTRTFKYFNSIYFTYFLKRKHKI